MSKVFDPAWHNYAMKLVPAPPGTAQYEETRKAFYAGAKIVMTAVNAVGEEHVSEEAGVFLLASMETEIDAFFEPFVQMSKEAAIRRQMEGRAKRHENTGDDLR